MAKEIWLGPILSHNRDQLIQRCSRLIQAAAFRGDDSAEFLYIPASRPLLDYVTGRLLEASGAVWGSLPVHLFSGFVNRVLSGAIDGQTGKPISRRIPIDSEELPLKRSLIARLIKSLARAGRISTLDPLVGSDGCVNSIAHILGEIQRAAKSPAEFEAILTARSPNLFDGVRLLFPSISQSDFDREICVIYKSYRDALDRADLTEEDTNQLVALSVLRGDLDGRPVACPWLGWDAVSGPDVESNRVRLLVLDGFFDFTPIQGEILRLLIPRMDDVVISLNHDTANPEVFRAFDHTIEQLSTMADFKLITTDSRGRVAGTLAGLRPRLFNSSPAELPNKDESASAEGTLKSVRSIRLLECDDRETEIEAIGKDIKRLVLEEGYAPSEICLVVRELASYASAIHRIFGRQGIPLALERRLELAQAPVIRAALKLFEILDDHARGHQGGVKVEALADLIKTGYFRLSPSDLEELRAAFKLQLKQGRSARKRSDHQLPYHLRAIPYWNPDRLENAVAYVGEDLRIGDWLIRARKIAEGAGYATVDATGDATETPSLGPEPGNDTEGSSDLVPADLPRRHSSAKPAIAIEPEELIWASLVFERLWRTIRAVPVASNSSELRAQILGLAERFGLAAETARPINRPGSDDSLASAALDLRTLKSLRLAIGASAKAFEVIDGRDAKVALADFLEEIIRALGSVVLPITGADPHGVRALEVTDVRGLEFRAIFIAGLVEGGFPLRVSRDWIYPQEQREALKPFGLTLEDLSPDTLLKEEHYFYQAACRATERLYLTLPLTSEDGNSTVASYYVEEARRAVAPEEIQAEVINRDFEGNRLSNACSDSEAAVSLVRTAVRSKAPAQIESILSFAAKHHYLSKAAIERIGIERQREGPRFGLFDGRITEAKLLGRLARTFGPESVFSASAFNLYGNCPFKFFARRILKLEPRGEAAIDLRAIDAGSLLHDVLKRFFEKHRLKRLDLADREGLVRELNETADRVFDEREQFLPPLSPPVWRIDREIRKVVLQQVLDYERSLEKVAAPKNVRPGHFELAYGMKDRHSDPASSAKYLELSRAGIEPSEGRSANSGSSVAGGLKGAETALVRGRIDRVDIAADGTLTAYDYKLSRGPSVKDMREGRDVQIALYIEALEKVLFPEHPIAGGGYYALRGRTSRRNNGMYRRRMTAYTNIRSTNASSMDDEDWLKLRSDVIARIWTYIDGMRAGHLQPTPSQEKTTCAICDYAAVCRYEVFRIRRKQAAASREVLRETPDRPGL